MLPLATSTVATCLCLKQKTVKDVSNFDREFTNEAPKLTPTDKLFIMNLDQTTPHAPPR